MTTTLGVGVHMNDLAKILGIVVVKHFCNSMTYFCYRAIKPHSVPQTEFYSCYKSVDAHGYNEYMQILL